jgi:hypothetical protein
VLILEEAAYCDPNFFYETLAPILLLERTSLLAISTLTSEINFYSRLMKMKDSATGRRCVCVRVAAFTFFFDDPMPFCSIFTILQIQLACEKCIEDGRAEGCVHLLHLAPRWQSTERHRRLKVSEQLKVGVFVPPPDAAADDHAGPPGPDPVGARGARVRLAAAGVRGGGHRAHVQPAVPGGAQQAVCYSRSSLPHTR